MARILIVDDERELCCLLAVLLAERGHVPEYVHSGEAAIAAAGKRPPDLILLDLQLGGMDGLETLRLLRQRAPEVPIVMITAFGDIPAAVSAMKLGATDFISKPFDNGALLATVQVLLEPRRGPADQAPALVGESAPFAQAMTLALKFAVPDISVLLLGETGTGKELFARTIHAASKRSNGPFVAVDCSMLAENLLESELFGHEKGAFTGATSARIGRFELAQGGTLFLDEIGNPPVGLQAKLLRVLQERRLERVGGQETIRLDVRVISATNVNLQEAIRAGRFRQDLYYRLQEIAICLPPLRERPGDTRHIAEHFLRLYSARFGTKTPSLSDAACERLERYAWPGNIRELENAMKAAVVLCTGSVLVEHLPAPLRDDRAPATMPRALASETGQRERIQLEIEVGLTDTALDLKALGAAAAEQVERSLLRALVRRGSMSGVQMAKLLGVDPKTLRAKLRRYGLEATLATEG